MNKTKNSLKRANASIKLMILLILTMPVISCTTARNDDAVCQGLRQPINSLQDALLIDGGEQSVVAGANVIAKYDAGCYE